MSILNRRCKCTDERDDLKCPSFYPVSPWENFNLRFAFHPPPLRRRPHETKGRPHCESHSFITCLKWPQSLIPLHLVLWPPTPSKATSPAMATPTAAYRVTMAARSLTLLPPVLRTCSLVRQTNIFQPPLDNPTMFLRLSTPTLPVVLNHAVACHILFLKNRFLWA